MTQFSQEGVLKMWILVSRPHPSFQKPHQKPTRCNSTQIHNFEFFQNVWRGFKQLLLDLSWVMMKSRACIEKQWTKKKIFIIRVWVQKVEANIVFVSATDEDFLSSVTINRISLKLYAKKCTWTSVLVQL